MSNFDTEGSAAIDSRFDISDVISAVLARIVIAPEPIRRTPKAPKRRKRRAASRAPWRDDGDPYSL